MKVACCELVKVNLTIIIIQRIMHALDCAFGWALGCAFDKSNVCGSQANADVYGTDSKANAFTIL